MSDEQGKAAAPAQGEKKGSDLLPRVVTSVVALPGLIALVMWGPPWLWASFLAVATAVALDEINRMLLKEEPRWVQLAATGLGLVFFFVVYGWVGPGAGLRAYVAVPGEVALMLLLAVLLWAGFLLHLMRDRAMERAAGAVSGTFAGVLYVGYTFVCLALLKRDFGAEGAGWVLILLAMTWMSDTGAYFVGRAVGRRRLAPKVSPKKSVEGAVGGLVASVLAALAIGALMLPALSLAETVLLAVVANFLGQVGDLCESLLKRSVGVKDSGRIIHGHGGILDRMDAVLFTVPWVYAFALYKAGHFLS